MNEYFDIGLKPDAEMKLNELLNKVYSKFHKALSDLNANDIGVSFPEYKVLLGKTIRAHSSKNRLVELQELEWLGGLSGYCDVTDIQKVPNTAQHCTISRWQHNMSEAHLRRLIKRAEVRGESISEEEIKAYRAKMFKQQMTERSYIELQSGSNGHKHRRYIQFGELVDEPVKGEFDTFGLSKVATIPWF